MKISTIFGKDVTVSRYQRCGSRSFVQALFLVYSHKPEISHNPKKKSRDFGSQLSFEFRRDLAWK